MDVYKEKAEHYLRQRLFKEQYMYGQVGHVVSVKEQYQHEHVYWLEVEFDSGIVQLYEVAVYSKSCKIREA